jgi:hypothetical protein
MIEERSLTQKIADVLNVSLDGRASVLGGDGHVLIAISDADFEHNIGHLFRQASLIIDEAFPNRPEDISLVFQDNKGVHQQKFRLWHSNETHFNLCRP